MNPQLCSAAAAPTSQPLPRPLSLAGAQDPQPGPGDAPGELCLCWAQSRELRAQLGAGTALLAANPEPGPAPGSLSWLYPPDSPGGADSNSSPLFIEHESPGDIWAQQAGHTSPLATRSSSSALTALSLQSPLVPAPHPASGPGWPWGSLSLCGDHCPLWR